MLVIVEVVKFLVETGFNKLPDEVAQEVVYCWLRQREVVNLNRQLINYLIERLKTLNSGKKLVVSKNQIICPN